MSRSELKVGLFLLTAVVIGVVLGGTVRDAAQAATEGQAGSIIALVGDERNNYMPVVLVDVRDQTLVIYEYNYGSGDLKLQSARSFRADKMLRDFNTDGPTVDEVEVYLEQQRAAGGQ